MMAARARTRNENGDLDAILRACAGALLGALPLLYTMEMWWYARVVTEPALLALLAVSAGVVVLSIQFGGFRRGRANRLGIDVLIVFGIGIGIALPTCTQIDFLAGGERRRFYAVGPPGAALTVRLIGFQEP